MTFVKSEKLYSPQAYLEAVTGKSFLIHGTDDVIFLDRVLQEEGFDLWSFPLSEIDEIVGNELSVVLVDCLFTDKKAGVMHEYRWFEVPEDFVE